MREKNSKRVVIIDQIDSDSIEQAILILRNNGVPTSRAGASIVSEAERIINSYVQTMEGTMTGFRRGEKRSRHQNPRQNRRSMVSVGIALCCFAAAAGLLFHYFGDILSGF